MNFLPEKKYGLPSWNFVKKNVLCEKGDEITRFDGTLLVHWFNYWFLLVHFSSSNIVFLLGRSLFEDRREAYHFLCGPRICFAWTQKSIVVLRLESSQAIFAAHHEKEAEDNEGEGASIIQTRCFKNSKKRKKQWSKEEVEGGTKWCQGLGLSVFVSKAPALLKSDGIL